MTYFEPVIDRLRVEAFRGFRDAREFSLSAAAVIITGPNGTGKTSFFDALQWGLLGRLERLEALRARRNDEHIVNQYRLGRKASVEIDLNLSTGPVTVRRTGDQSGTTLELRRAGQRPIFGDDAENELRLLLLPRSELTLEAALTTSGLMQQDVMRRVLEAKPADRYRQLSTVLGLGALEDFEEAARSVAKQATDRAAGIRAERARIAEALKQAQVRLEMAQARLTARPQVAAVRDEAAGSLAATPAGISLNREGLALDSPAEVRLMAAAFGKASEAVESAQRLAFNAAELQAGLGDQPSDAELESLRAGLTQAESALDTVHEAWVSAQDQLSAARRAAADMAQLAALAVPLLSDHCPVCGQAIDRDHVERELRERAETTETIVQLQQAVEALSRDNAAAAAAVDEARSAVVAAEKQVQLGLEAREASSNADAAVSALDDATDFLRFERYELSAFLEVSAPVLEYIGRGRRHLLNLLEIFENQADQGAVDRAAAEISGLETTLAAADTQLAAESSRAKKLQTLSEQTLDARVEVTEERLRSIQPLVENIFQRLDPHPAFKTVEFELDTYYRRGTTSPLVIDEVENVSADPLLIFSTSQANIVALSYFIAMSLSAAERGLPFLLLDDPVQSMDDVNVLGFADLCRHLRSRRQLIVSTHERRFASLLERKLAPRAEGSTTKMIRFTGWDRGGPTVDEHFIEPQLLEDPIRLVNLAG